MGPAGRSLKFAKQGKGSAFERPGYASLTPRSADETTNLWSQTGGSAIVLDSLFAKWDTD